jgi:hypothetical protein
MAIFVTIFLVGLILAIIMIGLSFLGDFDLFGDIDVDIDGDIDADIDLDLDSDFDFDSDIDGTESYGGFSFLSPYMISFFLMGVGIGGTFLEESYDLDEMLVYSGSLVIGLAIMLVMQKIFRGFFVNTQVNSLVQNKDFTGAIGVVTLRVPEGDIGEVAVSTRMGRIKMAARSDQFLPQGTKVKVIEKLGTTLRVISMEEIRIKPPIKEEDGSSGRKGDASSGTKNAGDKEEGEFTFEAYRKKEEAKKPTVIYDQRTINIKDSVINKSNFSELAEGSEEERKRSPGEMKREMKKEIADGLFTGEGKDPKEEKGSTE